MLQGDSASAIELEPMRRCLAPCKPELEETGCPVGINQHINIFALVALGLSCVSERAVGPCIKDTHYPYSVCGVIGQCHDSKMTGADDAPT